ncbi:MAG: NAD(+) diphosphatase [Synechococcales cyanobacterium RM1_1_8]|nr:NAD(+) diphosphatase [Synechococcales cyanobacterium RM1_1_8]
MSPFTAPAQFRPGIAPPKAQTEPAWWFVFQGDRLLVQLGGAIPAEACEAIAAEVTLPRLQSLAELQLVPQRQLFLGWLGGRACYGAELEMEAALPQGYGLEPLRSLFGSLDGELFAIAGRAIQLIAWDRNHQFCGHCATPMVQSPKQRTKRCPSCGLRNYPQLSPAVIMLIYRGEELLLARAPRFRAGLYSVLAGFVEAGESLEETVARETEEEVGVTVKNIRYFGSQPWPFPNSLMIGFTAEYDSGEIVMQPGEIEAAAWFTKDRLPPVPGPLSIARQLIDAFVAGEVGVTRP